MAVTEALESNFDSESSILSTFSCTVNGKSVRTLNHGGCQSNLISENLAKALNLMVLKEMLK